jgi:uncharacterized protein
LAVRDEPHFARLQRAFARHLRDPEHAPPPPGLEARRLALYRDAVYANSERFLADNFPRVRAVMDDDAWHAMVRDYLVRHVSWTAAFVELPREFLDYLARERGDEGDPPYLGELAPFDGGKTLGGADRADPAAVSCARDADLLAGTLVLNPTLRLATYSYPVHAINADFRPAAPPATATRIAAFRDLAQCYAFLDLSPAAARLLERLQAAPQQTGRGVLESLAAELGRADLAGFVAAGSTILERMRVRGAILGCTPST